MSDSDTPLKQFIRPILGLTAWGVRQGYGSFLDLNFGPPRLIVSKKASTKGRLAYLKGEWNLWINCCHWRIIDDGVELAWSEDDRPTIDRATSILNGQNLVTLIPDKGRSQFQFDLGGLLETWPYDDHDNRIQWTLSTQNEYVSYRADGFFSCTSGDTSPESVIWRALQ